VDASLLLPRGGVRSLGKFKLVDGKVHELFFLSRTTAELIAYKAALLAIYEKSKEKPLELMQAAHKLRTELLAGALCDEKGAVLMTPEIALRLDFDFAQKLADAVVRIDQDLGEAGKD
jgi:hypothetical protein